MVEDERVAQLLAKGSPEEALLESFGDFQGEPLTGPDSNLSSTSTC